MTVAELIEQLQRHDPALTVVLVTEFKGATRPIIRGIEAVDVYRCKVDGWTEVVADEHHREAGRLLRLGHPRCRVEQQEVVAIDDAVRTGDGQYQIGKRR